MTGLREFYAALRDKGKDLRARSRQARDDEQFLVFYAEMLRFREQLDTFPEIKAQYLSNPEVQSLLALCEELPQ